MQLKMRPLRQYFHFFTGPYTTRRYFSLNGICHLSIVLVSNSKTVQGKFCFVFFFVVVAVVAFFCISKLYVHCNQI